MENFKYITEKKLDNSLLWLCPFKMDNLIRIGDHEDGGYVVPQAIVNKADALLSYGLGETFTFEMMWNAIKSNDTIHLYDGTGPEHYYKPHTEMMYDVFFGSDPKIRHFKQNIGPETVMEQRVLSFVESLDRVKAKNIFIKMDIERAEFPLIQDLVDNSKRIVGIAMEFHDTVVLHDRFKAAVEKLKEAYTVVHFHGNNYVPYGENGLTDCLEVTFVRKDLCKSKELRHRVYLEDADCSCRIGGVDPMYYFDPNVQ